MSDFNDINNLNNTSDNENDSPIDVTYEEVKEEEAAPVAEEVKAEEPVTQSLNEKPAAEETRSNGASSYQYDGYNPSSPYYTNSNEYVYSPDQTKKSSGKGGKIALTLIALALGIFVVAVSSISAFIAVTGFDPTAQTEISQDRPERDPHNKEELPGVDIPDVNDPVVSEAEEDKEDTPDSAPVNINTDRTYPTLEQLASPADALGLPDIYDKVAPSVVGVSCTLSRATATGTGIIISSDGYIITNAHVVEDAEKVVIIDHEMNEYEAEIIGADSQTDIAVLKVEAEGLAACEFGVSANLRIGELAVAIGNPLGFELYGTMTSGIISGLNRTITIGENEMTLIQTNASINSGNSGGPLIDAYGRVIGITSAKVASTYGEGLGFAIPIDEALPIVNDLIKHGYVTGRPMIGISGEDITSIMSMYYRLPQGVYVRFVTPESAADVAGIKAGDIIIGIQGESITTMEELNSIKNQYVAGDTITLTVYRDGTNMEVDLTLGEATTNE
ncbi:MAG: trypsin-like peptidase domain-containing protein [Oscillospiraceae bacterium]|nr:trypsin-like peptidase domain-containing protein [Oscillospiraceae bacterium]